MRESPCARRGGARESAAYWRPGSGPATGASGPRFWGGLMGFGVYLQQLNLPLQLRALGNQGWFPGTEPSWLIKGWLNPQRFRKFKSHKAVSVLSPQHSQISSAKSWFLTQSHTNAKSTVCQPCTGSGMHSPGSSAGLWPTPGQVKLPTPACSKHYETHQCFLAVFSKL